MSDQSKNIPASRPRLGARPFAGRPAERPAPAPPGHDPNLVRPFAAPVGRPPQQIVAPPAVEAPVAEAWTTKVDPSPRVAEPDPLQVAAAVIGAEEPSVPIGTARPGDDAIGGVRVSLDEELSHFTLKTWEMPPVPSPFPDLEPSEPSAPNDSSSAIAFSPAVSMPGLPMPDVSMPDLSMPDLSMPHVPMPHVPMPHVPMPDLSAVHEDPVVALHDPLNGESLSDSSRGAEPEMVLREVLDAASALSLRVDAADALDAVARRVRSGEINLAATSAPGRRTDAALLVAVLAALLGERS
jgi:hypothetical protein